MKRIKIVKRFFSKAAAKSAATYQRSQAKREGFRIAKIETVCARKLFEKNGWFKNNPFKDLGTPPPNSFMVIVHYRENKPASTTNAKVESAKQRQQSIYVGVRKHLPWLNKVAPSTLTIQLVRTHSSKHSAYRIVGKNTINTTTPPLHSTLAA